MLHRLFYGIFRDFVEDDSFIFGIWNFGFRISQADGLGDMPGDGLALPVGVGREINYLGLFRQFFSSSTTASLPFTIS